jgi:hypothetical protein
MGGDDVAPTSLNEEGRGGVVPALVAVFHPPKPEALPSRWMGRWWQYKRKVEQPAQTWECAKCGKAEMYHFGTVRANGVSRGVAAVIVPRTSRATEVREVCVSNAIYQNVYLIRLINISAFLSN